MSTITSKDGTEIYYKEWGEGPAVIILTGWPLNSDASDSRMLFLARTDIESSRMTVVVMADQARPPREMT